jgi:hypothetical protein
MYRKPLSSHEPNSKRRLSVHGGVAPPKRDLTSIFMNIKEFVKPIKDTLIEVIFAESHRLSTLMY